MVQFQNYICKMRYPTTMATFSFTLLFGGNTNCSCLVIFIWQYTISASVFLLGICQRNDSYCCGYLYNVDNYNLTFFAGHIGIKSIAGCIIVYSSLPQIRRRFPTVPVSPRYQVAANIPVDSLTRHRWLGM